MQLGKQVMRKRLGWLAGVLIAASSADVSMAQTQTSVPDAPTPQTLPAVQSITPLAPPLPAAPEPVASTQAAREAAATDTQATTSQPAGDQDGGPPPELGANAFKIVVNTNFVQVPFTVKDRKNQLVPGLTPRDVRIYENGLLQHITNFTVDPFPLSVALVIDQSVTDDVMRTINNSLAALQGAFTPYDEVSVFTYNNGVTKQTDFTAAQSARLGAILERSKGKGREPLSIQGGPLSQTLVKNNQGVDPNTQPQHNGTISSFQTIPKEFHTLNDAILAAAQSTIRVGKGRRRIVYVISDGKEYGSKATEKQVIKYLQTNNISVYATLVGDSSVPGLGFLDRIHLPLTMRDDVLPRYAAATGGQVDPEFRQRGIETSFQKITEEVRNQYTIGYYTKLPPYSERFRPYEIRVLRPSLTVIAPSGYYPRPSSPAQPVAVPPSATP